MKTEKRASFFLSIFLVIGISDLYTQERKSLEYLLEFSYSHSPKAQIAQTQLSNASWTYKAYEASLKPKIQFNATLPNLIRSINSVTQDDGTEVFRDRFVMTNRLRIQLEQTIKATGGTLYGGIGLQRIDILSDPSSKTYLATPISLGFRQPVFGYNQYKWLEQINPLELDMASTQYLINMEDITEKVVYAYMDLWSSISEGERAQKEVDDANRILTIGQKRFDEAFISEAELIQIKLALLTAKDRLSQSKHNQHILQEKLRAIIGIEKEENLLLEPPSKEFPNIKENLVDEKYDQYAAVWKQAELDRLKAEAQLIEAKAASRQVNLFGEFGLTQTADNLSNAFQNLQDQELFQLGIQVPIADWGYNGSKVEIAKANMLLSEQQNEQLLIQEKRELMVDVERYQLLQQQFELNQQAVELAQRNYELSVEKYLSSSVSLNDLLIARNLLEVRELSLEAKIKDIWKTYYKIRRTCLYDFKDGIHLAFQYIEKK